MNVFEDIKSRKLLIFKGLLFLFDALIAADGLLLQGLRWDTLALLLIFGWNACRFYYFFLWFFVIFSGELVPSR